MTIHHPGARLSRRAAPAGILRRLAPPRHRTAEVIERLASEITGGRLAKGARLPTEQEMMAGFGVSRTVVREAVAALRAEGLVETRQGLGAFVASDARRRPFRIDLDDRRSIADIIDVMELRLAVEVETAGLAAERGTARQIRIIGRALAAMDAAIARGEAAIEEDFAFHRAIAAATGNQQFTRFLEYLGRFIIPRQSVPLDRGRIDDRRIYLDTFQREHRAIHAAIAAGDPAAARAAMREHLMRSSQRYRQLMRGKR
ncbi:MAG TPA: FCD domain-containing protein [Stellaceae bacterium]|nr:FCD domain-containing protein [Stellaceae bacterium]